MLSFPAAVEMFDLLTPEELDADGALWIDTSFRQGEAGDSGRKLLAAKRSTKDGTRRFDGASQRRSAPGVELPYSDSKRGGASTSGSPS